MARQLCSSTYELACRFLSCGETNVRRAPENSIGPITEKSAPRRAAWKVYAVRPTTTVAVRTSASRTTHGSYSVHAVPTPTESAAVCAKRQAGECGSGPEQPCISRLLTRAACTVTVFPSTKSFGRCPTVSKTLQCNYQHSKQQSDQLH